MEQLLLCTDCQQLQKGVDIQNKQPMGVQAIIEKQIQTDQGIKRNRFALSRKWKDQSTQQYQIDGKSYNKTQYENFIESLGISFSNPYNIVQQGKINQITLMDEFEIYKLFEQAAGLKKFQKRFDQTIINMRKIHKEKKQIELTLKNLQEKFQAIDTRKQEFQYFAIEQKTKKYRMRKALREQHSKLLQQLNQQQSNYKMIARDTDELLQEQRKAKQQISFLQATMLALEKKILFYQEEDFPQLIEKQNQLSTQQNKSMEKKLSQINKLIKQKSKSYQKKSVDLDKMKETLKILELKYQTLKSARDFQANKKQAEKFLEQHHKQIAFQKDKVADMKEELQKLEKNMKFQKVQDKEKHLEAVDKLQKIKQDINCRIKQNKIQIVQANRQKNNIQSELEITKNQKTMVIQKMRKILPSIDITLLEHIQQHKIQGVYGYFIDFLEIYHDVRFAYEIANLNKLCILLVEDDKVATQVIQLNKKIKGKQISIMPLNFLRKSIFEKKPYPNIEDATPLISQDLVKVSIPSGYDFPRNFQEDLKKLLNNTFCKYMLVKDYDTALSVSKQYHMNCITMEKEIVYSQGYLCKVGRAETYNQSKISIYQKFMNLCTEQSQKLKKLKNIEEQLLKQQNYQIELSKNIKSQESIYRTLKNKLNQVLQMEKIIQNFQAQKQKISNALINSELKIKNKQELVRKIKQKKLAIPNKQQFDKNHRQYNQHKDKTNAMINEIYLLEQQITNLNNQRKTFQQQLKQYQHIKQQQATGVELVSNKKILQQLIVSQHKCQKDLVELFESEERALLKRKDLEEISYKRMARIDMLQVQLKQVCQKLDEIGQIEEKIEEMEELSNSMSVSMSMKKKHHFTMKDKIFFSKFVDILQTFKNHKEQYKKICQIQQKINELMVRYGQDVEQYMQKMIKTFEKQFDAIFKRIVKEATTDVRFKKISEKVKGSSTNIKYRNCLSINVTFNKIEAPAKKWNSFSGGQRTVIAIAIIMSLQKCQPAPFYIFDEVDSALDKFYIDRIAEIIMQQSKNSQYFITSFKRQILQFPEEICNYYLVENSERRSAMGQISMDTAKRELIKIIN